MHGVAAITLVPPALCVCFLVRGDNDRATQRCSHRLTRPHQGLGHVEGWGAVGAATHYIVHAHALATGTAAEHSWFVAGCVRAWCHEGVSSFKTFMLCQPARPVSHFSPGVCHTFSPFLCVAGCNLPAEACFKHRHDVSACRIAHGGLCGCRCTVASL